MKMPSDRSERACRSNQEPNFRVAWARHHKSPLASTHTSASPTKSRAQSSRPQPKLPTTLPRITTCPGADIWTTSRRTPHRMRGSSGCGCVEYAMRRSFLRCAHRNNPTISPPPTSHLLPPPPTSTLHLLILHHHASSSTFSSRDLQISGAGSALALLEQMYVCPQNLVYTLNHTKPPISADFCGDSLTLEKVSPGFLLVAGHCHWVVR